MDTTENNFTSISDWEERENRKAVIAYGLAEGRLISDAARAALDPGNDSWRGHAPYKSKYGVGAILVDDSRLKLTVDEKRFRKLAFSVELLGGWNGTTAVSFVAQAFNRLFWMAKYCVKNNLVLEKRQVAGLFRAADVIVGILSGTDDTVVKQLSCLDERCFALLSPRGLETLPPKERRSKLVGELLIQVEYLHRAIDLLLIDCAMGETFEETLKILDGRADKEKVVERLKNDEGRAELFEKIRENSNLKKAAEEITEAAKWMKEQRQEVSDFPKTDIWLPLAEAAELFWTVFCKKIEPLPQCTKGTKKGEKRKPESFLPAGAVSKSVQANAKRKKTVSFNLSQWFRREVNARELKKINKDWKGKTNVAFYEFSDYYSLLAHNLTSDDDITIHDFEKVEMFEAIRDEIANRWEDLKNEERKKYRF